MHEKQARLFLEHVAVQRRDLDPTGAKCLDDRIDLARHHHKVAGDRSVAVPRRLKAYAGRNAEGARGRNRHAVHRHWIAARDAELIDAAIGLAFDADNLVELRGIKINRRWGSRCRWWGEWRLAFGKCRADCTRQFDRIAVTADMHVEGRRTGAQQ